MAKIFYTVDNMISEVRNMLGETNEDQVDTLLDILPALNRAQDYAFDVYARKYPEPILKYTILTPVDTTQEYDIPEDAFEDRVLKMEVLISGNYVPVKYISFHDISDFESNQTVSAPNYYTIIGRKIRLIPAPNGIYTLRMWYLREPETLVAVGGRITTINSGSNYLNIDALGTDSGLSADSTQKGSYINIVDGQTGEIKQTMQIQSIADTRINLRSSPVQSTVFNRTVSSSIDSDVALDDYICIVTGTCVAFYGSPTSNFMIQYAMSEITRKLGGAAMQEEQILTKFENQIERTFGSRELQMRVKKLNPIWGNSSSNRRIFPNTRN